MLNRELRMQVLNTSPDTFYHHLKTHYFPAGLSTHLAPLSCASDLALADHYMHLQIIFAYVLTYIICYVRRILHDEPIFQVYYMKSTEVRIFTYITYLYHMLYGKNKSKYIVIGSKG